ncbi:MAG: tetratricopeptide repeat protein [Acidobacteriota bacterium]|nr:tetratricopeptide repeat protein [Acidobacteriota bacterium]
MNKLQFNARLKSAATNEERIAVHDAYAEELFTKENYAEAAQVYEQALKLAKQPNVKAYLSGKIGICHYNDGQDKLAIQYLQKSTRLFQPDTPEFMPDMYGFVLFHLGALYEYHGKAAKSLKARKDCEEYVDSQEKDTKWMLYSGISRNCEALGQHSEAIRYSQKAIQVLSDDDPSLSYLYESMANSYMELQQYQEAIRHYSRVLELDPEFERRDEIQAKLADCYRLISNYAMALETYEKILKLKQLTAESKDTIWIHLKIAECHFRMSAYEKSLLAAMEALHRHPPNPLEKAQALGLVASNYCELGRHQEAVADGEKALKLAKRFPNDDIFYVRMALAFHKLGDKKAFEKYRGLVEKLVKDDNWNRHLEKLS